MALTQQVASLVRTGDSNGLQPFDGNFVSLMAHQVPDHRDKEDLLVQTWHTARELLQDQSISDSDALEYAALIAAAGILYIHPFVDGNGRTSRALSYLISTGAKDADSLEKALSETAQTTWQIVPKEPMAEPLHWPIGGEQPKDVEWEFQFANEGVDPLGGKIVNSHYSTWILRKFIESADEHTKELIESCATRSETGDLESIDGDKLLAVLAADEERGIDYARTLLDIERNVRSNFVKRYLGGMLVKEHGPVKAVKHSELQMADSQSAPSLQAIGRKISQVLNERQIDGKVLPRDEMVALHRGYSKFHRPKDH